MSCSVLVAILTSMAVQDDNAARLAFVATAVTMLLKKPLPAIAVGILTAAILRQI